jgi:signal peptidase I
MNYYFMMGDNRDNSADSRAWGFVPENHISGKAWMVFFSHDPNTSEIRWKRMFSFIR